MKTQKDLIGLSRSSFVNGLHSIKDSLFNQAPKYDMHGLIKENKLKWFFKNLGHLGNSRFTYQKYSNEKLNNGIFKMYEAVNGETTVALLSDWASDTKESRQIAKLCGKKDYSIHLGDTYYVGNSEEIARNFNDKYEGCWPYGNFGSFALLGNHEMYSGGKAYFKELIPYMGNYKEAKIQEASFFCLENNYWRIIGIDTGYNSIKGSLGIKDNCDMNLPEDLLLWLENVVKLKNDNRGLIFLSHHQAISAFDEKEFKIPAEEISKILGPDRTFLWLWGHEHFLSFYGSTRTKNGSEYYARCIGNSGMPIELGKVSDEKKSQVIRADRNLVMYDEREKEVLDKKYILGYNGYAQLTIENENLSIDYFDCNEANNNNVSRKIVSEKWKVDIETGKLQGIEITDLTESEEKKLTQFFKPIKRAISNPDPISV